MNTELKLISMRDIQTEDVQWLWYPYLPRGKLTIVQGDPGEGKTTFVLAVISALTRGEPLPECEQAPEPVNVIYQTAEDGLADTIKPRLETAGADCARVLVIDESKRELNLSDERLEQALRKTGAQLMVLDPIQAYLGDGVNMHRANEVRPILKRTAAMAERTGCAVILIGHMNKAQGLKSGYRGLGSIDFRAAARSVLVVGRLKDDPAVRIVAQDKNSLAPEGKSIAFQLDGERGFKWKGTCDLSVDDVLSGSGKLQTKTLQMEEELERMLREAATAEAVLNRAKELGVSERTLMRRTGLAPMNGKSSLQGGQAERLSDFVGLGAAGRPAILRAEARTHFTEVSVKQKKEKRITLRLTPEQYEKIRFKAETAHMSIGAYVRATALKHRVVVIDGLEEITHELKGIGRSINQLAVLSNMGRIKEIHLGEVWQILSRIYLILQKLTEQEKR